jgi:CubicO group peptidase (beta-lactamase class C family)
MINSLAMRALFLLTVLFLAASESRAQKPAAPESVGFSSQRLERLHQMLQRQVDSKALPGAVTILARHGKIVDTAAYGKKDLASGAAADADTIFRIYSMTKPVTGVAMMILYEQGKWSPSDPISKHIPEFADLKVFKGMGSDGQPILEKPAHAPTMAELMSHTAGFSYGFDPSSPVDKMYLDAKVFNVPDLKQMVTKLAGIPLLYQPGTKWVYSLSVDIQGYVVEKLSGKPLGEFMRENIFQPLGMKDTAFFLNSDKLPRLATLYTANAAGALEPNAASILDIDYSKDTTRPLGGAGLVSTARDYLRFAQMLLDGGQLDGTRILAPSSVMLMRTNRLTPAVTDADAYGVGFFHINRGFGFGFDFGVFDHPGVIGRTLGEGSFTWEGAAGSWFWIDPTNDIVFVGMMQRMVGPGSPDMSTLSQEAVYQALVNPEK